MEQESLAFKIAEYIQNRAAEKLEKFDKEWAKQRNDIADPLQLMEWEAKCNAKRHELENNYILSRWLTDAARRAKQISMVTHALKFTHTDAKGSSIYAAAVVNSSDPENSHYVSTASIPSSIKIDVVGNAAALDVASFLQLEQNGESLIAVIARGDSSPLQPFAESENQLSGWMNGFQQVLIPKELSSHTLAKQLYFPVGDNEYHLLSPLFASSLVQELYQRVNTSRYGEAAKEARKAKREKKYFIEPTVDYPNVTLQKFGGTKPQNVSQLNSNRRGQVYLFSSAPPSWDTKRLTPPTRCVIYGEFNRRAWRQAKELQEYLLHLHIQNKTSTQPRRLYREEYVDGLIDTLFNYATQIHCLDPGWSVKSPRLPEAQQLWLDPKRSDADFQQKRAQNNWQEKIADTFAHWVNKKIKHEKLTMADAEYNEWRKQLMKKLQALLKEDLEVLV